MLTITPIQFFYTEKSPQLQTVTYVHREH